MKVLHLVDGYPPAGGCAGRWCQGLSRALAARGVAVQVLSATPRPDGSELASGGADIDEGVRVQRVVMCPPLYLLRRLRPGFRTRPPRPWSGALRGVLVRAVAAHDVVHMHGVAPPYAWWAALCCRLARRPLVYSPGLHDRRALTASVRGLASRADAVVVFHPGERDWLRAAGSRIARLEEMDDPGPPPGTRCVPAWRSILGLAEGDRLVVFPGRADWQGGAVTFIDAVRLLRLAGLPVVPAIVNPGPIDDWLRRLWRTSLVPIVGIVVADAAERAGVLAAADLIVLPDHSCGALLWGGAAETPILAPQRENSAAPDGALRFPAGDPLALAREMGRLLRAPAPRRDGAQGRRRATAGWSSVAARMEAVYRELVAARRR